MKQARIAVALVLCIATAPAAQFAGPFRRFGPRRYPAKFADADSFGHGFTFCLALYTSGRREAGGQGWSTDYPDAELNFTVRLSELTKTRVSRDSVGAPDHVVVRLTEDAPYQCPYLHMEDVGTATLTPEEIAGLRSFLLKGGFLWVDDYWGSYAWDRWIAQLERVLSSAEFPVHDLTFEHPIFKTMFEVTHLPQVPSIQFWRMSGGSTSERGADSITPHIRDVSDQHGNLMVRMTHNTDISDAWERESEDSWFFAACRPTATLSASTLSSTRCHIERRLG